MENSSSDTKIIGNEHTVDRGVWVEAVISGVVR